ncbi:MAG: AarF/ABC1/UbiB kinase family protein [Deltaproteobacteria bacterium]|nr:AarF/ABC1/UbiB kinase family protein [Deltaproteobacteria bacterium]
MLSIRKIGVIGRTYRNLNRYSQILGVLFKYGFGDLVETLKIDQYLEIGLQMFSRNKKARIEKSTRAERLRMAFEELGPTYIKLGQILSTRPDLVPPDFISELAKLQDEVPSFPFNAAKRIVESELGSPLEKIFASFDEKPLASASIGQVHKAALLDGDVVAVKVQRPGIKKTIEVDLEIMLHLATLAEKHIEGLSFHRPVKVVEEFAKTLERELDYGIEIASMERVARQFLDKPYVYIPKVYGEISTERVLTAEFVNGIKVSHLERLEAGGYDKKLITRRGADICLSQIFNHGFFHADPHPGNIFVLPGNVICLLDFGMVGSIDRNTRESFVELVDSIVRRDETRAAHQVLKLTSWEEEPDVRAFERDVAEFMGRHLYKPLKEINLGRLLQNLLELAAVHRLRIYPDIFLMLKALATVESVAEKLDPDFDMVAQATPFIARVKLERLSPKRIESDLVKLFSLSYKFVQEFPRDLLEVTRLIRQQKLSFKHELEGLDRMLSTHDQISNRISFSIVIAALIIGSALIVISNIPPLFYGISMIGIIGFLAAAIMGIWLLVAILKKGSL